MTYREVREHLHCAFGDNDVIRWVNQLKSHYDDPVKEEYQELLTSIFSRILEYPNLKCNIENWLKEELGVGPYVIHYFSGYKGEVLYGDIFRGEWPEKIRQELTEHYVRDRVQIEPEHFAAGTARGLLILRFADAPDKNTCEKLLTYDTAIPSVAITRLNIPYDIGCKLRDWNRRDIEKDGKHERDKDISEFLDKSLEILSTSRLFQTQRTKCQLALHLLRPCKYRFYCEKDMLLNYNYFIYVYVHFPQITERVGQITYLIDRETMPASQIEDLYLFSEDLIGTLRLMESRLVQEKIKIDSWLHQTAALKHEFQHAFNSIINNASLIDTYLEESKQYPQLMGAFRQNPEVQARGLTNLDISVLKKWFNNIISRLRVINYFITSLACLSANRDGSR